jgi:hypothetical protein
VAMMRRMSASGGGAVVRLREACCEDGGGIVHLVMDLLGRPPSCRPTLPLQRLLVVPTGGWKAELHGQLEQAAAAGCRCSASRPPSRQRRWDEGLLPPCTSPSSSNSPARWPGFAAAAAPPPLLRPPTEGVAVAVEVPGTGPTIPFSLPFLLTTREERAAGPTPQQFSRRPSIPLDLKETGADGEFP